MTSNAHHHVLKNLICIICDNVCNGLCPSGLYGTNCSLACSNCNFGSCNNAQNATVPCSCNTGFDPSLNCADCFSNNWGPSCSICGDCNGHGICNSSLYGNGKCICNSGFDESLNCSDCLSTYFGPTCSYSCSEYCFGNGYCSYGITGSGRCNCDLNYDPTTNCEKTFSSVPVSTPWQVPVIVTIGSVAFIAIVISVGFFCVYRKMKHVHEEISISNNVHSGVQFENEKENSWEKKHVQISADSTTDLLFSSN